MARLLRTATVGLLAAAVLAGPLAAGAPAAPERARPFSGLGSWVDLYNRGPWKHPERVVAEMARHGVQTLYLETSSYKFRKAIVHPGAVAKYLDLAHEEGMSVVAWYVPSFKEMSRDLRRSTAAIDYISPTGETFDGFALDIEATVVADVRVRNERTEQLSQSIRLAADADYPLGAIVPDPVGSLYWVEFPYLELATLYDAFLPMSYFTFRVDGADAVRRYVRANVEAIRVRTAWPGVPVHPIGGIADAATDPEVRGYVAAVLEEGALGGSLYDFPLMRTSSWEPLERLRVNRMPAPEQPAPPMFGHGHLL